MITSIYIDNYRCFSNFEYKPGAIELILGDNGTGKSTLLEVLRHLKSIVVDGRNTQNVFVKRDLTAWDSRREQKFELEIASGDAEFKYSLTIEHSEREDKNRIKSEKLVLGNATLYHYDGSDAHLHRDDGSTGPTIPYDWNLSFIATIPARNDNKRLVQFRECVANVFSFAPDPIGMTSESDIEVSVPNSKLSNLSGWLRHLFQDDIDMMQAMRDSLKQVIAGLQTFKHEKTSERSRTLQFQFNFGDSKKSEFWLPLDDLSDGQCQIIGLYAIQHAMLKADRTVVIDEPDNFVALREIQPWLTAAKDAAEDNHSQLWIISHSTELIDYLAPEHGVQFYRSQGGPVRTKRFKWDGDEPLRPSEIIARGWE
jgi:AAA15 family ATPase/GTPase